MAKFSTSFNIPFLPKPVYESLKAAQAVTGLTDWQLVILGTRLIKQLSEDQLATYARHINEHFPPPVKKNKDSEKQAWDGLGTNG